MGCSDVKGKVIIEVNDSEEGFNTAIETYLDDVDKLSLMILVCNLCEALMLTETDTYMLAPFREALNLAEHDIVNVDMGSIERWLK